MIGANGTDHFIYIRCPADGLNFRPAVPVDLRLQPGQELVVSSFELELVDGDSLFHAVAIFHEHYR
jgi:hypothetical protein